MKIEINLSSFRLKIIITLILVIASISFISLFSYNYTLSKKVYKNAETDILTFLYFFRDQIISIHDGRTIRPSLEKLKNGESIKGAYLFDDRGNMLYPEDSQLFDVDPLDFNVLLSNQEDISLQTYKLNKNHFSRASIRFSNAPSCYSCHSPEQKVLGFIVIDFSMHEYENTVAYTRNFSVIFTLLMVGLIIVFILVMHYRFIRKSLSDFKSTINLINSGNLHGRVKIPESKELGELGKSFNAMVDHFQLAQEELQQYHKQEISNKQKLASIGEMSARLAHEIRNPITGIANAVEIIIEESEDNQNKPILEEIRRQANRVNKAITNLLNYSRTKELNIQEGDLNDVVRSVVFFLESQVSQKVINFEVKLDEKIPLFRFDQEQIENVLLNLGFNAIQTIDNEGTIMIESSYEPESRKARISVKDTGKGIPQDKISEIFNPFFTMRTEGTGLGLAIVKEIVEMHHGEIRAANNPDKGSTFQFSLPLD